MEENATQVPTPSYLPASSTSRSQAIYWMGLGGGAVFIVFWCILLEDQFPLFFFPSISQLIVGFSSFGSFAFSFLWVSSSISHCFSDSILASPHEIVGGCWTCAVDTLSTLGSLFSLPLTPCVVRVGDRSLTGYEPDLLRPRLRLGRGAIHTIIGGGGLVIYCRSSAANSDN